MPTILRKLEQSPEDHEMLHDMYRGVFLEGECYAFAIALNQGLNWPMAGLMKDAVIWHAGVRAPDGRIHDVRGLLTEEEFGGHFLSPPFDIREITANELYATRPVHNYTVKRARQLAEVLWPELPWVENHTMKAQAFADELEALSRKYGLWITGGIPADPPRLFTGGGDEGGYEVRHTIDGLAHTITRYLR
ncbi:MAG: hypothetical protein AB202_00245 [Parcubacteria bacterium C7867-007]|nr:MAG: hypothetical protein AB202_00245 [Parcubacteria bacterium C7867-007]